VWSFQSAPGLHPQKVTVNTRRAGTAPGLVFIDPTVSSPSAAVVGQTGPLILDDAGNPVWFRPLSSTEVSASNFQVQRWRGRPVLTWWQGIIAGGAGYQNLPPGDPEPDSCYVILDDRYRPLRTIEARDGYTADQHELILTPRGTALYTSTKVVKMDLRPYGGPEDGAISSPQIQEVDLDTGALVFTWSPIDHIDLAESEQPAATATASGDVWDAFHVNSIQESDDGSSLLVSMRNTWTVYKIDKRSGAVQWRLGGRKSDFAMGSGAAFAWQHDARWLSEDRITLFDDGCCELDAEPPVPAEQVSHGLTLTLDEGRRTASATASYFHDPPASVASQGNVQTLPNGDVFVGWGAGQWFSELRADGNSASDPGDDVLLDVTMPGANTSYRAFRLPWTATPAAPPVLVVHEDAGSRVAFASWNGSTETRSWRLLAGADSGHLHVVSDDVPRTGFEVSIPVRDGGPLYAVQALDGAGRVIGESHPVRAGG
jgi:hypothetical protein